MYTPSFIFILISFLLLISSCFTFTYRKIFFQTSLLFYILCSISRPMTIGIDTQNFLTTLNDNPFSSLDPGDPFKYGFIYIISFLVHSNYKIALINLACSLFISFSLYKYLIVSSLYKTSQYWRPAVLVVSSVLFISFPLILVHTRQYLSFAFLFPLLLNFIFIPSYNPLYLCALITFSFLSHPIYFLSALPLLYIRFRDFVIKIRIPYFSYLVIPLLVASLPLLSKNYQTLTGLLPGFSSYGVQETSVNQFSLFSVFTLSLLFAPAIIQSISFLMRSKECPPRKILSPLLAYTLFLILSLLLLELSLPFLYSIGRVKSAIYPLCIPLLIIIATYRPKLSSIISPVLSTFMLFIYTIFLFYSRYASFS